jgi:POT family proton-dependent oligopeptide transporter
MIFMLAPVLNIFWAWQNKSGREPSSVTKMGIGCILCGSAYILMILASMMMPGDERGSVLWLLATVLIFTIGELYLSPIGLSLVTKVAPKSILSMMMGMWFLSSFFGNYATGLIGTLYDKMPKENFFGILTVMGVATGIVFMIIRRPIQRAIGKHV